MKLQKGFLCFGSRLWVHLLLIPLIFAAYFGHYLPLFCISWCSALLHEAAHVIAGGRLHIAFSRVELLPFGVCAKLKTPVIPNPLAEILCALTGPFSNLMLALMFGCLGRLYPFFLWDYGVFVNLGMCALNLLPCLPLDGGRVLRALLTMASDALFAHRVSLVISRMIAAVLFLAAAFLLLTARFQFSLLLIGAFLLGNLLTEQKSLSRQMLRELLYYKEKRTPDDLDRVQTLTAAADLPARKLLRKLSYHNYCVVFVLDEENKPMAFLTETQIISALLHRGIRLTLGEIL